MVHMFTLGARRRHDRRIGDGRAVVAADRSRHAGGDGYDHQRVVCAGKNADDDRYQYAESAPGSAGGEGYETADEENDGGKHVHQASGAVFHDAGHIFGGAQAVGHGLQRPGQRQDQDSRDHGFKTFRQTFHAVFKGQDAADLIDDHGDDQGKEAAIGQTLGSVAGGEGLDETGAGEKSAGIDHAQNAADDQADDGDDQIDDPSVRMPFNVVGAGVRTGRRGVDIAFQGVHLMQGHGAVIRFQEDKGHHHDDGQQGVIVIRDRLDEQGKPVFAFHETSHGSRP